MKVEKKIKTAFERNEKALSLRPSVGQGTKVTKVRMLQGLRCEIEDGGWKLNADMEEPVGGEGSAPNPGVLGRAALGSCLAIGYTMWAAKLGVPLSAVEVEVQADYDHRGLFGIDDEPADYRQVRYVVTIESDAPEADLLRMMDEADAHSPWATILSRPQDLRREVHIVATKS